MPNKTLTLSLIIPAYNEQAFLKSCLDSIAQQSVMPDEVFVVDNNSNDGTVEIARQYKFVKVLHEPRQHQSFAQTTGFNAASSDILGRIDADSVLPLNWVKNVKRHFAEDTKLMAITGGTTPYDVSIKSAGSQIFRFYINFASRVAGTRMLWGADCALRRGDWLKVKDRVMLRGDIWEDYDLAFCLAPHGKIEVVGDMDVASSFRSVHKSLVNQIRYQFRAVRTFYFRTNIFKTALYMVVWASMFLVYLLTRLDKYLLKPALNVRIPTKTLPENSVVPQVGE